MSTTNEPTSHAGRFLAKLRKIANDRGKMAALRRGASEATKRQAWPVIAGLGEDVGNLAACTVGAFFAEHPEDENKSWSLGETCRRIALAGVTGYDIPDSFEKRFLRLLSCDTAEEVAGQLKAWIRFAKARGIRVNYEQMFWDLDGWHRRADDIKLQWARGFWPVRKQAGEEPANGEAAP
jgi:CRISPR type I-E-associated protein CasB/Cse2